MLIELGDKKHGPVLIDGQDKFGDTPLHLAAREGHKKMTRLLLRNGANPNLTNAKGSTPLHIICIKEDIDEVKTFFELSEDEYWPVQVNVQDELGNTPLHLALNQSKKKVAELLLGRGSDPNVVNKFGSTPLHVVCGRSHFKDDDLAATFFAINRKLGRTVRVDTRDALGRTPLERAVPSLLPNTIDVLLDNGVDLSSFVFPSVRDFDRDRTENLDLKTTFYKMKLAAGVLACVERLTKRGYQLDMSDALTVMKFFARHNLFEKSTKNLKSLLDNMKFWCFPKLSKFKPDLTLYDLIRLRPKEAAKRLTYTDYYQFTSFPVPFRDIPSDDRSACGAHLAEKLSRGFFLRWGYRTLYGLSRRTVGKSRDSIFPKPRLDATTTTSSFVSSICALARLHTSSQLALAKVCRAIRSSVYARASEFASFCVSLNSILVREEYSKLTCDARLMNAKSSSRIAYTSPRVNVSSSAATSTITTRESTAGATHTQIHHLLCCTALENARSFLGGSNNNGRYKCSGTRPRANATAHRIMRPATEKIVNFNVILTKNLYHDEQTDLQ
ncbi:unnamed protein product, partial [Trichogramma brassicae]